MIITRGKHWSYDGQQILDIFGVKGLKLDAQAFLGYSLETMHEANCTGLANSMRQSLADIAEYYGNIGSIRLSAHIAQLLFFENVLTPWRLSFAKEDDLSITTKLFDVRVIICENPEPAIVYYDLNDKTIRI